MNSWILIPTYNERANVHRLIPMIFSTVPDVNILVIDDNSPDGTGQEVKTLQNQFPTLHLLAREKKQGLGQAYMDAFAHVFTDHPDVDAIITMDADLSHDPKYLLKIFQELGSKDVVIGSRYVAGGSIVGWELRRKLLSACGNFYCRLVTRMPIHDCTSGFIAMKAAVLRQIDFSDFDTSGYAFLMYLKYKLWQNDATIQEIPICFANRIEGESKISMSIIEEGMLLPWRLLLNAKHNAAGPRARCPLCKTESGRFWFTKNACSIYRCTGCNLIFISPLPDTTTTIYSEDYFCGAAKGFGYVNYDADKESDARTFSRYIDRIEAVYPSRGRLLDVGAATGAFLQVAKTRGWDIAGVEISPYAAAAGRDKGLNIQTGTLASAEFPPSSFDVITLWDVFEHVTDVHATLDIISRLLKPQGLLVLNTPDAGSINARLMNKRWALIIPPEHLHIFQSKNLRTLLIEHHFSWVDSCRIGKSYPPAYILQILYTIGHQAVWKRLSDWMRKTPLNRLSLPINLRDNMFVIAMKEKGEDRTP